MPSRLTAICLPRPAPLQGDNDPVDVVEIGSQTCDMGGVYQVKPLGEREAPPALPAWCRRCCLCCRQVLTWPLLPLLLLPLLCGCHAAAAAGGRRCVLCS